MKRPDDDETLVNFLRQHRPEPPTAAPDLEDQIIATIASDAIPASSKVVPLRSRRRNFWITGSAIAAGLIATVASYRVLVRPPVSDSELTRLETYLETSWYETVTDNDDAFPL